MFVRTCSNHPHLDDFVDIFEEDEGILDSAIDGDALKYLRRSIVESNKFHEEVSVNINLVYMQQNLAIRNSQGIEENVSYSKRFLSYIGAS